MANLYVDFDDRIPEHRTALEQMIEVPFGTFTAVEGLGDFMEVLDDVGRRAELLNSLDGTPVGDLDAFLAFGYGPLTPAASSIAEGVRNARSGSTHSPALVAALLVAQGAGAQAASTAVRHGLGVYWR